MSVKVYFGVVSVKYNLLSVSIFILALRLLELINCGKSATEIREFKASSITKL